MNSWKSLLHKLPIILLNLIIRSCKVFVLLTKIESWNQENEDGHYERNKKPKYFVSDVNAKVLILSSKKGGSDSWNVEEHRNTYLHKGLDDSIFLLLNNWNVLSIQITGIKWVDQAMDKND
jgi:hypothetical protein